MGSVSWFGDLAAGQMLQPAVPCFIHKIETLNYGTAGMIKQAVRYTAVFLYLRVHFPTLPVVKSDWKILHGKFQK